MGRIRGRDAKETRAAILEAAIELFSNGGYVATSMADLAQAVGMTQGVLYFHFENKEALLVAAIDELEARLAGKLANAASDLPATPDVSAVFRTLVDRVAHVVERDPRYFWFVGVIGAEAAGTNPRIEEGLRRAYARVGVLVETVIRQAMSEKVVGRDVDVACAAQMFIGLYLGGIMHQRLFRREFPFARARPVLVDLLHATLVPQRSRLASSSFPATTPENEGDRMGDKSPKAKDKNKKQDAKHKDQKKNDAQNKANIMAPKKKP